MNEIVGALTSQLGIPSDQAEGGLGAILGMIQQKAPEADAQALMERVPEAKGWMAKAAGQTESGGGLLGQAAGLLGGSGGDVAKLVAQVSSTGMTAETAKQFVPVALRLLKEKAGDDVFERLIGSVPFLEKAMGDGGGLAGTIGGFLGR